MPVDLMQQALNDIVTYVLTIIFYLFLAEIALTLSSKIIAFVKTPWDSMDLSFMKRSKGKVTKK